MTETQTPEGAAPEGVNMPNPIAMLGAGLNQVNQVAEAAANQSAGALMIAAAVYESVVGFEKDLPEGFHEALEGAETMVHEIVRNYHELKAERETQEKIRAAAEKVASEAAGSPEIDAE